eukprot:GEMP01010061.1.p1 GENE.GEMP01010061.1~~GEMP01010061.1.p1  ORF type:complete len:583 (+),score=166.30 GEMP01010061.1:100-1848(+)
MSVTAQDIDRIWQRIDSAIEKLAAKPGAIKRQKYEADILALYGDARDKLEESLRMDRQSLVEIFGGDCLRIAHLATILDSQQFSTPGAIKDQRTGMCRKMCTNVEGVLQDLGLSERLKKAYAEEETKWQKTGAADDEVKPAVAVEEPPKAEPPSTAPVEEPPEPEPPAAAPVQQSEADAAIDKAIEEEAKKPNPFDVLEHLGRMRKPQEPCSIQVVSHSLDDDQTQKICATTSLEQLRALECPSRTEFPGQWMVYQVHRAYLNDSKLTSLDFTNMHMPTGKNEPAIAPKLLSALQHNTKLTMLILDNCNFQSAEAPLLANSLAHNTTLNVLNVDNNAISNEALMKISAALSTNTSGVNILQLYNQLSEPKNNTRLQETLLHAASANKNLTKIFFEFEDPFKEQVAQILKSNYAARPCCVGCGFEIPSPGPPEAQCIGCKQFVCSSARKCPLDSQLKTLKQVFEKGLPFELVGFPQHCWRNPVELDNLRSMLQKNDFNAYQAMDQTPLAKANAGKMCKYCLAYVAGEALYEFYRTKDDGSTSERKPCWWGKHCRTQTHNMRHASSLNHVVPQTRFQAYTGDRE